jgi:hypothetical protein
VSLQDKAIYRASGPGAVPRDGVALFSPDGALVLDGWTLFDTRSAGVVHRFDRLSPSEHGVVAAFHPAGNRVVLNSAVWDLRRYVLTLNVSCVSLSSLHRGLTRVHA